MQRKVLKQEPTLLVCVADIHNKHPITWHSPQLSPLQIHERPVYRPVFLKGKMQWLDVYTWILTQDSPQCEYMMVLSAALSYVAGTLGCCVFIVAHWQYLCQPLGEGRIYLTHSLRGLVHGLFMGWGGRAAWQGACDRVAHFWADRRQRCYAAYASTSLLSDTPSGPQPVGHTQRLSRSPSR